MAYEFITYRVNERIAYVTINRERVMNALHPDASVELRAAFTEFRDGDDAWVAILTGAGEHAFSAGNDLKAVAARSQAGEEEAAPVPFGGITRDFECSKPIIAAVNGFALGGGFELAMACDIIIAAEHARFGLPEPRVGFVAAAGGMHRLPQHVGLKVAMGLLLTGRQVTATTALQLGIVNEVVVPGQLMAAAGRWASEMLECSPVSLRITKEAVLDGLGLSTQAAMQADQTSGRLDRLFSSEDFREGPSAFVEKRSPAWKGR